MYFKDRNEYRQYLDNNKIENYESTIEKYPDNFFEFSEKGDILLEESKYQNSAIDVESYSSCKGWVLLNDGKTMALLKNPFGDVYRDLTLQDYYIALYNNILMPQIAKQLQNETAMYYFARIVNKGKPKDNRKYILTLDFKRKSDELILGEDIIKETENYSPNTLDINKLLNIIEQYLTRKKYFFRKY